MSPVSDFVLACCLPHILEQLALPLGEQDIPAEGQE